jgi:PD-(D/E)XK nuclease superfamily protein
MDPIDLPRRISYSQYTVFANCPHAWKLQYVDKLRKKEASIHLTFGTSVHEAIQEYLVQHFKDEKRAKQFDVFGLFKERLLANFVADTITHDDGRKEYPCDKKTLKEFFADGEAILMHVRKQINDLFPTKNHILVGCEIPLEVMLTDVVQFIAYLDIVIVDQKTGEVYIHDLKTSGKGWFYEKKDPIKLQQVLLYKKFYAEMFDVDEDLIFVDFIILKRKINENAEWEAAKNRVSKFSPTQGKIATKKAKAALTTFHTTVFNADGSTNLDNVAATPSEKACRFCPVKLDKTLCPNGWYK